MRRGTFVSVVFPGSAGSRPGGFGEREGRDEGAPGATSVWKGKLLSFFLGACHQLELWVLVRVGELEC